MGNLKGPWVTGWIGDSEECEEIDVYSLKSKLKGVFQCDPSGTLFIGQRAETANSVFALIKKLKCGSCAIFEIDGEFSLQSVNTSDGTKTKFIPNFPVDIEISGLTQNYTDGNGEYLLTSRFQENSPTYQNKNGWIIQKNKVNWELIPKAENLEKLENSSSDPIKTQYKTDGCAYGGDCQVASNFTDTITDTDDDDDGNDDIPEIENIKITDVYDTQFTITWNGIPDIQKYEIEISDSVDFSQTLNVTSLPENTYHTFNNLTSGLKYFVRLRYIGYKNILDGQYQTRSVTTTLSGKNSNLTVNNNSNFYPVLNWDLPANIKTEYKIYLKKSRNKTDWETLKTFESNQITNMFVDDNITDKSIYYYALVFDNGKEGSWSDIVSISVDKSKPSKPKINYIKSPIKTRFLNFKWSVNDQNKKIVSYKYKFNTSEWISYNGTELQIPVSEGVHVFKVKSIDSNGNESDESIISVSVDNTPPTAPVIQNINSPTHKREIKLEWNANEDVDEYSYRFNNGSWIRVDKNVNNVNLKTIQGENIFEIKSYDTAKNESKVSKKTIMVDFLPPTKPTLNKISSPNKNKSQKFSWSSVNDLEGYKYRTTTWKNENSKNVSDWIFLNKNITSVVLTAPDGFFRFELLAYDSFGNNSEIDSITIVVDHTPPALPTVKEIDFYTDAQANLRIKYKIDFDESTHGIRYKFNGIGWDDKKVSNDSLILDFGVIQGKNKLEIYSYDLVGNQSNVRVLERMVDTISPPSPKFIDPIGVGPEHLHESLWNACKKSAYEKELGVNTKSSIVNFTYSLMNKETLVYFDNESRIEKSKAIELVTDSVSEYEFMREIESAFRDWKRVIEDSFNITINFINLGKEKQELKNIPSGSNFGISNTQFRKLYNIADIRIGMCDIKQKKRILINSDDIGIYIGNDIHIDKNLNWSVDSEVTRGKFSIRYAMRYYIGRWLGLPLNTENTHGTQHGLQSGINIKNRDSSDKNLFFNVYGFPNKNDQLVRLVEKNKIDINWGVESDCYFEYRYAFISEHGRLIATENWKQLSSNTSKTGNKTIIFSDKELQTSYLRFYVRSFDEFGNRSDESHIDLRILDNRPNINLLSVSQICEPNYDLKYNNNCWDKYGLFSAELMVDKKSLNKEKILLEVRENGKPYSRYELVSSINDGKFIINSLKADTTYYFRVRCIKNGHLLYSESSFMKFHKVGTIYGDYSNTKALTTDESFMEKPSDITLLDVKHYKFVNSNNPKLIFPRGESDIPMGTGNWKPTALISWSKGTSKFFKYYKIEYWPRGSFHLRKFVIVADINQTSRNVTFDEYDRVYELRISLQDSLGNLVVSGTKVYKTVPLDKPPVLDGNIELEYAGDIKSGYNERPNSKWTLKIVLPNVIDADYPSKNKIKDVEIYGSSPYSSVDWMASIGRFPLKIESKSLTSKFTYWITATDVYDENFNKTDIQLEKSDTGRYYIKTSGYEENRIYDFKFTAYDTSGHYSTKVKSFLTKRAPAKKYNAPNSPILNIKNKRYLNGFRIVNKTKESLADYQWVLEMQVTVDTIKYLSSFLLSYKLASDKKYKTKELHIKDYLDKTYSVAGKTTFKISVPGFLPTKLYNFKIDSVNIEGSMSSDSRVINYITSVGDTISPPATNIKTFNVFPPSTSIDKKSMRISLVIDRPKRANIMEGVELVIMYTSDLSHGNNYWKYESVKVVSNNSILKILRIMPVIPMNLSLEDKPHKIAVVWRDSAYNWGPVTFLNTNIGDKSNTHENLENLVKTT